MGVHRASTMITLLSILIAFSSFFRSSEACGVGVYWGQNSSEGSLQDVCSRIYYKYVNIAFLNNFGDGQLPGLNLTGHCDPAAGTCQGLSKEIRFCQTRGVKVLLSLGGSVGNYSLTSLEDARNIAGYLWAFYLSGNPSGPLGDVSLDGIDFNIIYPQSSLYWDELARILSSFSTPERKIYLSAAPQCVYPDTNLDAAIKTGLFDYVWVQFYDNPICDYSGGAKSLLRSWNQWSLALPEGSQLSLGLPASPQAAGSGFIPIADILQEIFPEVKLYQNYGGITLWNRYWDRVSGYTVRIGMLVCDPVTQRTDA